MLQSKAAVSSPLPPFFSRNVIVSSEVLEGFLRTKNGGFMLHLEVSHVNSKMTKVGCDRELTGMRDKELCHSFLKKQIVYDWLNHMRAIL